MNIAVYLGSRSGNNPNYALAAKALGEWIGKSGNTLVYGGSDGGLMGILADAALSAGARIIGVVPNIELIMERRHEGLSECIYTQSMAERRSKMIELADAFVVLPGGLGTIDEISEVMSLASLEIIKAPIVFFGADGYHEPMKMLVEHILLNGFAEKSYFDNITFTEDINVLESALHGELS